MKLDLPSDWHSAKLNNVAKVSIGLVTTMTENYAEAGVPLIRNSDIKENKILKSRLIKLDKSFADKFPTRKLKEGDVVTVHTGEVGTSSVIDAELDGCLGFATLNTRVNLGKLNPEFICWYFNSPSFISRCVALSTGDGRQNLNLKDFAQITVPLPSLAEQKKIAEALSIWNQAIATTEQLLESSQQQKKALMQQLLAGNKRLAVFNKTWGKHRLENLFSRVTTRNNEASTNVVTISAQHGLIRQEDYFNKPVASETLDNYFLLKKGQFAYNKSYSNGYPMGAIKRLNKYEKGVVTTLYICFEVRDETSCSPEFFEHYFESGLLNNSLSKVANEGGRAHGLLNVKPSDFFGLTVYVP